MELEEALALIEKQKATIANMTTEATKTKTEHEKALQKADNQGYDRANNANLEKYKNHISKEEADNLLSSQKAKYKTRSALEKLGVNNPKNALKLIDEEDAKSILNEDFDADAFKEKYSSDLVFKSQAPKAGLPPSGNDNQQGGKLTADKWANMSSKERSEMTSDQMMEAL